ncbi:MAG: iron-containing alcohol dehydrogenase family protein [Actinomycetota bacterium]
MKAVGPEIRFGGELAAAIDGQSQKALLVCSARSKASPTARDLRTLWGDRLAVGPSVRSHTPLEDVHALLAHIRELRPDLLVALGGGSVIDAAKIGGAYGLHGELDIEAPARPSESQIPVLAIPTTFAAAENTKVVGVSVGPAKAILRGPWFAVETAVYVLSAFRDVPRAVLRDSGVNGFVHAVECAYSRAANPISDALSRAAAATFWQSLPKWWGGRDELLEAMVRAGIQAGFALRDVGVGLVHALGHVLGVRFGMSHGVSNAAALLPGMAVNLEDSRALRIVSEALSLPAEKAAVMRAMDHWLESLVLPSSLASLPADIRHLVSDLADDFTLPTNPVAVDRDDFAGAIEILVGMKSGQFDDANQDIRSKESHTQREA